MSMYSMAFLVDSPIQIFVILLFALLRSPGLAIPPGEKDYAIESGYTLPVDVEVVGVFPHLHYLGREVRGWAELPDGTRQELLFIRQWDFNWQGDYPYATPPVLPKGTKLKMRYTFDNSAGNARNPHQPPKLVHYGPEMADEMGDLSFQLLPRRAADLPALQADYVARYGLPDSMDCSSFVVACAPLAGSKVAFTTCPAGSRVHMVRPREMMLPPFRAVRGSSLRASAPFRSGEETRFLPSLCGAAVLCRPFVCGQTGA